MKIQCGVCDSEEASVFCCADEAALCGTCDRRVHHANKLAGKHRRYSLLLPSSAAASAQPDPLCDICQEKRGFMFCKEDRAILCKDCDAPIHTANHLTMKHNRFLLTGARLSPAPIHSSSPSPEPEEPEQGTTTTTTASAFKTDHDQALVTDESVICSTPAAATSSNSSISTGSSISEYLIKMLPGWRVEDLLVDDAAAAVADGICKTNELLPFLEADLESGGPGATAEFPLWLPYVPQIPPPYQPNAASGSASVHYPHGFGTKEVSQPNRWSDDTFTVPQIPPASGNNKRPRPSLWY